MSIFKRIVSRKPTSARLMMEKLELKPLYEYEMLEQFTAASIDEILSNQNSFGRCRLIGETEKYLL